MDEPVFDPSTNEFYIDVYVFDINDEEVTLIDVEINYSNSEWLIDEDLTSASAFTNLSYLNADDIQYSAGTINIIGFQPPLNDGPVFTTQQKQHLLSIYFTATARSCSDITFEATMMVVTDPGATNGYNLCEGSVGMNCEIDNYCIAGFDLGGLIESPVIDCDGAFNGGIPLISVPVTESNNTEIFNCETSTDAYGEYECAVVADLDYIVAPVNDYLHSCGLSSLDIDIYQDHILATNCIDYLWQLIAGDCTGDGVLSSLDLVQIQKAILEEPVSFPSWTFVPSSSYNLMSLPSCPAMGQNTVPSYDPFIEVDDIDEDNLNLDFVGIKMGDANGTCTDCSDSFSNDEEIHYRSSPVTLELVCQNDNELSVSFEYDIEGLEVVFLAIECDFEPSISYNSLKNKETFITRYINGVFYVRTLAWIMMENILKRIRHLSN